MRYSSLERIGLGLTMAAATSACCIVLACGCSMGRTGGTTGTGATGIGGTTGTGATGTGGTTTGTTTTVTGSCTMDADCASASTTCQPVRCVVHTTDAGMTTGGMCIASPAASGAACHDGGGKLCDGNGDCVACLSFSDCPPTTTACVTATCSPAGACGTVNASSGAICSDSGGKLCSGGTCVACNTDTDCGTGNVCQLHKCVGQCSDGLQDGNETDRDCGGGSCPTCAVGKSCQVDNDCVSTAACQGGVCAQCLAGYGTACGSCNGILQCDGTCSVATPSKYGAPCGSCGGTINCAGACSVATPSNLGASCTTSVMCTCGYFLTGTIDCTSTCIPNNVCSCCGKLPC